MNIRKNFPALGFKKNFKKLIIFLCRKDYTSEKILKMYKYSTFIFIFLYITIGLHWKISFINPKFSVSVSLNNYIWWSLILLQNFSTFFIRLFRTYLDKAHDEYLISLLKEKTVVVAYKDDKFELGSTYKTNFQSHILEGFFTGHYVGHQRIDKEKLFKFVSPQKNRKLKLKKLSNL